MIVMMTSSYSFAYSECSGNIASMFIGDGGTLYIYLANGGGTAIGPSDPNRKTATAFAVTALATGRPITIRYSSDGVNRSAPNNNFAGMWVGAQ